MTVSKRFSLSIGRRIYVAQRLRMAAASCTAILASYPKSGRTWVRFILANYFAESTAPPCVEVGTFCSFVPNHDLDPVRGLPLFLEREEKARVPLIAASHREYQRLMFGRTPVIFMIRDPRDLLVSHYFHASRHKGSFKGDVEAFLEDESFGQARYIRYMNSWAKGLRHHPTLVISYEEVFADAASTVRRVLRFIRVEPDEAVLQRAVERSTFDELQRLERMTTFPAHTYDATDPEALRVRRGRVGGYVDYLSPGMIERIEASCSSKLNWEAREIIGRYQISGVPPSYDYSQIDPTATMAITVSGSNESNGVMNPSLGVQIVAEALVVIGLAAIVIAPPILAIEVGEWLFRREWEGYGLEDGLALFGLDRSGIRETPWQQWIDMLLALPLTLCLFIVGLLSLLSGIHLGNWGVSRLNRSKRLSIRSRFPKMEPVSRSESKRSVNGGRLQK